MRKLKIQINKKRLMRNVLTVGMIAFACAPLLAQGSGGGAIISANKEIREYWGPTKLIIQAIGAIVGLVGGIRVYNKWSNGDQDINKELTGWAGACLFLTIVPQFVGAFFGLS